MLGWLLIETFGDSKQPTVIGVGSTAKKMVPLKEILARGPGLLDVQAAVARARRERGRVEFLSADGRRRTVAVPLEAYSGHLHGVHVWTGPADDPLPERDPAGAWYFNITTDEIGGSDGLLDLYGEPEEKRRTQRFTAEAFGRLTTDAGNALALLVNAKPGDDYQATWTVRRDNGAVRTAHFSTRAIPETTDAGAHHLVLRGYHSRLRPSRASPSRPTPGRPRTTAPRKHRRTWRTPRPVQPAHPAGNAMDRPAPA